MHIDLFVICRNYLVVYTNSVPATLQSVPIGLQKCVRRATNVYMRTNVCATMPTNLRTYCEVLGLVVQLRT